MTTSEINKVEVDVSKTGVTVCGFDVYGNKIDVPKSFFKPRPTKFNTKNMQQKAAMFSSNRQDWQTPDWFYNELCQERGIKAYDTDPATNKDNPLGCKTFYTIEDDGLSKPWYGNVFINPPFGWGYYQNKWVYFTGLWVIAAWNRVFKLDSNDDIKRVTMIIPASVSTQSFHNYLWCYHDARTRPGIRVNFYPKRIKFKGSKMVAPFNTMIIDMWRQLG